MTAKNMGDHSEVFQVKKEDGGEENERGAEEAEDGLANEDQQGKYEDAQGEEQLQPTTPLRKSNAAGAQGTPGTPGEVGSHQSIATTGTPGPTTPGGSQVHIQPYSYPPYSYFQPAPGYAPPTMPHGSSPSDPYGMAGSNSYQYMDVSNLHDPAPDTRRNRGGVTEPYPEKLHRMLEVTEREGLADVVSFFSHGRAFAIHKPRRFVQEIMPRFFRQTRLTSFQRQLNLYGFRRISQGPDNGGYYHELFLKGRPGLVVNMKRTKVKGQSKLKRDPETEPNFYSYPSIKGPAMSTQSPGHPYLGAGPSPLGPPVASPAGGSPYPGYAYPPPPHYPYQPIAPAAAPYTAAQQMPAAPAYPYHPPPYYGYPWYPPPPQHHMPPNAHQGHTPQASPLKSGRDPKTPEDGEGGSTPSRPPAAAGVETPGSSDSNLGNANSSVRV